jgi:uncharacterized protein (DUF1697 family)
MTKYVAMLRGVGPSNPNMTKGKFKVFFEELGFKNVQVILGSGNIIFETSSTDADNLAIKIEEGLPIKLGFKRSVIIRSQHELQNLMNLDPFKGIEQNHNKQLYLLITFFRRPQTISLKLPFKPENKPYTLLGEFDNSVYGSVDLSSAKTPDYMSWLEKQFGKEITSRTPKTIRLILSKMNGI